MHTPECKIYPIPFMPTHVMLARAYVPYQCYVKAYPLSEALIKGTLFPELYQPYEPKKDCWEGVR